MQRAHSQPRPHRRNHSRNDETMTRLGRSQDMSLQPLPRPSVVLASLLALAGIVLAVAGCDVTPLGPTGGPKPTPGAVRATPLGVIYKLRSPIILQMMHSQPPTGTGGCRAGQVQVSLPPGAAPM